MEKLKEEDLMNIFHELGLERLVTQLIREMGIQVNLKGYAYLRLAVITAIEHPELRCCQLYDVVSNRYRTKSKSVECAIRYAIDNAYDENPNRLQDFFPYPVTKPSNWEVIALVVDKARMWF